MESLKRLMRGSMVPMKQAGTLERAGRSSIRYDLLGRTAIIEFRGSRAEAKRAAARN